MVKKIVRALVIIILIMTQLPIAGISMAISEQIVNNQEDIDTTNNNNETQISKTEQKEETIATKQALEDEEEIELKSTKYLVLEEKLIISRIIPESTADEVKANFNLPSSSIHIYEDKNLTKEITGKAYVTTGMWLTCDKIKDAFELSVIGDINQDGTIAQIDLSFLIRHVIGLQNRQLKGTKLISADLNRR